MRAWKYRVLRWFGIPCIPDESYIWRIVKLNTLQLCSGCQPTMISYNSFTSSWYIYIYFVVGCHITPQWIMLWETRPHKLVRPTLGTLESSGLEWMLDSIGSSMWRPSQGRIGPWALVQHDEPSLTNHQGSRNFFSKKKNNLNQKVPSVAWTLKLLYTSHKIYSTCPPARKWCSSIHP